MAMAGASIFASFYKGTSPSASPYNAGQYMPYIPGGDTMGIGTFNPSPSSIGIGNMPGSGGQ